jgi:hypothetical protein
MYIHKFNENDIFINQIKSYPSVEFYIYEDVVYYNNKKIISGQFTSSVGAVPNGFINLYEENIDRNPNNLIYPFVTKNGSLTALKTTSTSQFNSDFSYGDTITGSYPLSASIVREYYAIGQSRPHINSLKNTFNYYSNNSKHYLYSSSYGNKATQEINVISIPSIFYGSQIKKGTVNLELYHTGTLIGQLQDIKQNGELVQIGPSGSNGSGSVAGTVLYNEGFIILTGSWTLYSSSLGGELYLNDPSNRRQTSWLFYGFGANDNYSNSINEFSYRLTFNGTTFTPALTMFAHAQKGQLNHSNNPTYVEKNQLYNPNTGSYFYKENELSIKNTIETDYDDEQPNFEKQTFISKIGIYDENKNLIAIATLAEPVKKTINRDLTFKLKIDL